MERMSNYEYTLAFDLADDCPAAVRDFFEQLTTGGVPAELPEADVESLEAAPDEVIRLLAGTRLVDRRVVVAGSADAAAFYMPFMAVCEWLARWSATRGPVGYYHHVGLPHPTLLYFADGRPYMLQTTGTPVGLADGALMSSS